MTLWSSEIKELESLYTSIKGRFPELEKELEQLIKFDDANVILIYSRRCLEVIISDLCIKELKRPRKTEPLKGIIDKLSHEDKVPSHIIASMEGLNSLSTFGAHPKDFDPEQVKPVLSNLAIIIKWYVKYKDTQIISQAKPEEAKYESKELIETRGSIHKPKKKLILLLAGIVVVIAIIISSLFIFNIIGDEKGKKELEKSIAVLPFKLLSDEPDKQYLADGMMDAILLHLSKIEDLLVKSRTSTEQYRVPGKTMTEIGRELGVAYLLEGSFQKSGDSVRLIVQLIKASDDDHVWSNEYDRNWNEIFAVQSEVAKSIARELHSAISPEVNQLIEKIPTANLTAYDFFQRGREEEGKFSYYDLIASSNVNAGLNPFTRQSVERAEKMYKTALKYDPAFALAYTGLAGIYWSKNYNREYFSENFLDSVLILANTALSFDDQLPDAYYISGMYYSEHGLYEQALENFNKTLELNPNYWLAYFAIGEIENDPAMIIKNYLEAASRHHGSGLSDIFERISFILSNSGYSELAESYSLETVKLESDSTRYYFWLWMYEFEYKKCLEFYEKRYSIDSTDITALNFLGAYYEVTGQFKESVKFYKKWLDELRVEGRMKINEMQRIGYAYWKIGFMDSADYYFNEQIKYCNDAIRLGRPYGQNFAYYDLAGVYAFMGNKIKAFENLKNFNQGPFRQVLWIVKYIKTDPLFKSIRNEPEFQQIVRDVEAKYQAEHERVRKWLEEQRML
jgi:TolB-like protein